MARSTPCEQLISPESSGSIRSAFANGFGTTSFTSTTLRGISRLRRRPRPAPDSAAGVGSAPSKRRKLPIAPYTALGARTATRHTSSTCATRRLVNEPSANTGFRASSGTPGDPARALNYRWTRTTGTVSSWSNTENASTMRRLRSSTAGRRSVELAVASSAGGTTNAVSASCHATGSDWSSSDPPTCNAIGAGAYFGIERATMPPSRVCSAARGEQLGNSPLRQSHGHIPDRRISLRCCASTQ